MSNKRRRVYGKRIAIAISAATSMIICSLNAAVVNITEGSTTGFTMTDGNTYVIQNSVSFSNSTVGGSGMSVADGATVVLYVPQGVTVTAAGANGNGRTGGGAGIRVSETSTLVITGAGMVNAIGGNAGNGANGENGEDSTGDGPGAGGAGGSGGGGAGSGIGGRGGWGGLSNAGAGARGESMGRVYLLGSICVEALAGKGGVAGMCGSSGKHYESSMGGYMWGGAGGGGGGAGSSPTCSIGGGGSTGGAGGKGDWGNSNYWLCS